MGANNPNFPTAVRCTEEAIIYLGAMVAALKTQTFLGLTGASATVTGAQMVGGAVEVSTGSTFAMTLDTAANVQAAMLAADANAGVGSTATFVVINDNSGTLTFTPGANMTLIGGLPSNVTMSTATIRHFQIKWNGATTVTLTVTG